MNFAAKISKIVIVVSALIAVVAMFGGKTETPKNQTSKSDAQAEAENEQKTADDIMNEARYLCMESLEKNLNDPDSAEWGTWSDNPYFNWPASIDGDVVTVKPKFRAANGFGGTVLGQFVCKLDKSDGWRLLDLREI